MVSGPGCPVCVPLQADIDKAIALAGTPGVIITSFGDMLRVPGSRSSLQKARQPELMCGLFIRRWDALNIARETRKER